MVKVSIAPYPDLDARIHVLRCGEIVDTVAIATERYLVFVDTMVSNASMTEAVHRVLEETGSTRPILVLNTHGDWDHVCGNSVFCGPDALHPAPVVGTHRTAQLIAESIAMDELDELKQRYPRDLDTAEFRAPTVRYTGSIEIDCGDLTLQTIPTPGHRPDHMAVWCPQLRLLLAGDAAENPMPFVTEPQDMPVTRESLRRMSDLQPANVLYCHAPGRHDRGVIDANIAYFDELEARCREMLTHGGHTGGHGDLASAIGWPLEDALPAEVTIESLAEPEPNFYHGVHNLAIRSMLGWLQSGAAGRV
jgi:glyoxylase-like metal-dependent hydrolase (beta-lactamase superfamily II)